MTLSAALLLGLAFAFVPSIAIHLPAQRSAESARIDTPAEQLLDQRESPGPIADAAMVRVIERAGREKAPGGMSRPGAPRVVAP